MTMANAAASTAVDPRLMPLLDAPAGDLLLMLGRLAHTVARLAIGASALLPSASAEAAASPLAMWRYFTIEVPAAYVMLLTGMHLRGPGLVADRA